MGVPPAVRRLLIALLMASSLASTAAGAQPLSPLVINWQEYFRIDWDASEQAGQPLLSGYVLSVRKYGAQWMQLLVDRVDSSGTLLDQRIVWLPSAVPLGGRVFFEVPVAPAASYRVSVYAYEPPPRP
jgi:hypothetical protein